MRLKSLTIDQYKNLKNFSLSFDGSNFIDVVSTLNAASFEVFRPVFDFIKTKCPTVTT